VKKVILGVVGALGAAVLGVLGVAAAQPDVVHVARSVEVAALPGDVYPLISDLTQFVTWSPWSGLDPNQVVSFSTPAAGVGAWYTWKGNDQVGEGKMTVVEDVSSEKVLHKLEFFAPWTALAQAGFVVAPAAGGSKVTWTYDAAADLPSKVMGLMMDMDQMLGADFEKGLAALKVKAEAAASARVEAEARAAAERLAAEQAAAAADPAADPAGVAHAGG